ncbi:hypothetical protein [Paenibacillus guangzhouensis]|uniref:hypothetical protein n=1 Tax=Paenibacillus guangzhouensis TaxID=1473112 RepID=UPI001D10D348|nr:hypothetical protein [Paenibacillus guangzhouensis]
MHNMMQQQPISGKELDYISDSITNEDLLLKQCAVAANNSTNPGVKQLCTQMAKEHHHHMQILIQSLQQHQSMAPSQIQ